jgi:DNA-binding beta-propeller fold protein YncE
MTTHPVSLRLGSAAPQGLEAGGSDMFSRFAISNTPGTRAFAAATLALAMTLVAGCASPPPKPEEPKLVWPPPPLPSRIEFVRSITSEADLKTDTTFTSTMATFLAGEQIPDGRIASPAGLAVSADGQRLYVADPLQHKLFTFDFAKKELRRIDVGYPTGVALDDQENIYVVDGVKKGVSVFDRAGKPLREINDKSMTRPNGIAVDSRHDRVYVVDTGSSDAPEQNVKIFDRSGNRLGAIGAAAGGDFGQFSYPTYVALDGEGNVFIADTLNGRVQKFDHEGKFVTSFGKAGSNWGEFDKPKGVALDTFGNLYVVDTSWSNVQIFNPRGEVLLFFGGRGPIPGMMKNPLSIAIDKNNRIYVGDYLNHRIGVYQLVNTKADDSFIKPPAPNPSAQKSTTKGTAQ